MKDEIIEQNEEVKTGHTADETRSEPRKGRYRHFKGGEYEVLFTAKDSETLESMTVYKALYGDGGIWVRPTSMFLENVERDGKTFPRFTYIGED